MENAFFHPTWRISPLGLIKGITHISCSGWKSVKDLKLFITHCFSRFQESTKSRMNRIIRIIEFKKFEHMLSEKSKPLLLEKDCLYLGHCIEIRKKDLYLLIT